MLTKELRHHIFQTGASANPIKHANDATTHHDVPACRHNRWPAPERTRRSTAR